MRLPELAVGLLVTVMFALGAVLWHLNASSKVPALAVASPIERGEVIEIMPSILQVKVGESIRIINEDIRAYDIGPFFVSPLQTLAMRFTHAGRISGVCSVNPEGEFVIEVTE